MEGGRQRVVTFADLEHAISETASTISVTAFGIPPDKCRAIPCTSTSNLHYKPYDMRVNYHEAPNDLASVIQKAALLCRNISTDVSTVLFTFSL